MGSRRCLFALLLGLAWAACAPAVAPLRGAESDPPTIVPARTDAATD